MRTRVYVKELINKGYSVSKIKELIGAPDDDFWKMMANCSWHQPKIREIGQRVAALLDAINSGASEVNYH